jgi:hypothetical protein
MNRAGVQIRGFSLRRRVWWFLVHVPTFLIFAIILVWGADFLIRFGANWAALVWLVVASPMWAFLAALFVIPTLLAVQYSAELLGVSVFASIVAQSVALAVLGAAFAFTTGAMSAIAGGVLGVVAAVSIAVFPVMDPAQRIGRAS